MNLLSLILHAAQELDAFLRVLNRTSLSVTFELYSVNHLNQKLKSHQNSLSSLGQICQRSVHLSP